MTMGEKGYSASDDVVTQDNLGLFLPGKIAGVAALLATLCAHSQAVPRFLPLAEYRDRMVLTAVGDCAYRRPDDGVIVCPIGCLRP